MASASSMIEPGYLVPTRQAAPTTDGLEASLRRPPVSRQKRTSGKDEWGLIERLKTGDEDALEAIFNLYSPKLYNIAYRILGNVADTQEVIQDVFWTAYRKARTFRGTAQFSTWLYRLTVNAALGKIRRSKKNKEVEYEDFLPKFQTDGHHMVRPVVDWSNSLDESYAKQEIQELLKEALDQLRPIDKAVVVLSDLDGMPDKEIAATLGITVSAVKTRLHRARLFLRGKLAAHFGHSPA
ncbi:MAG: sigma-70 family RNA polymerase sigma factor [Deltaproteobacteria bacterium]|nr:sigma-70 family RNA polymerase sigma factor [Deltaproteobacteria bacterium]